MDILNDILHTNTSFEVWWREHHGLGMLCCLGVWRLRLNDVTRQWRQTNWKRGQGFSGFWKCFNLFRCLLFLHLGWSCLRNLYPVSPPFSKITWESDLTQIRCCSTAQCRLFKIFQKSWWTSKETVQNSSILCKSHKKLQETPARNYGW